MTWVPDGERRNDDVPLLSPVFDRLARRMGAPKAKALSDVFVRWEEVVGESVAAHARPLSLHGTTLVVGVDEPAWATQLKFLSADLLSAFEAAVGPGVVAKIDVRVRPRAAPGKGAPDGRD